MPEKDALEKKLPDETIAQFRSDFKIVADCFAKLRKFHEKKEVYHPLPDEIRHVAVPMNLRQKVLDQI